MIQNNNKNKRNEKKKKKKKKKGNKQIYYNSLEILNIHIFFLEKKPITIII
jgi:hypothetical protein